jgi:hydrogenase expression/formation protein HypE
MTDDARIRLAHGGGGWLMRELVRDLFAATFLPAGAGRDAVLEDAAVLDVPPGGGRLAFTTDTFVVDPLFFPGGNVGDLAVNGTVNDLAMMGAVPAALSVAMVLEEGFPLERLREIVATIARAAAAARVRVATGDTKVVGRGQADGVYVNTSGIGWVRDGARPSAGGLRPGDRLILSGPIGDHGVAVMSRRAGLSFEADLVSDTAPLADLVGAMLDASLEVHALRDPTRGGLAAVLNELAEDSRVAIDLEEAAIPVRPVVLAACETLGLDPMHVPCEGRLVAAVAPGAVDAVLAAMRGRADGAGATVIGEVRAAAERHEVVLHTVVGGARLVDLPAGELLPRIC